MPTCPKCGGPTWDGHQCPADAPPEPRPGDMRVVEGQLQHYVAPSNDGGWQVMPLYHEPRTYTVRSPGVWYVAREMATVWHAEHHDLMEMRRLGRTEREIAKVLLREALRTLEEMED